MLRLTSATLAPASASARATPPVIPVPPPVTSATCPVRMPGEKSELMMVGLLPAFEEKCTLIAVVAFNRREFPAVLAHSVKAGKLSRRAVLRLIFPTFYFDCFRV